MTSGSKDRKWFLERLEDPTLLGRAVSIDGFLAVPVGGKRRGGYVNVADAAAAEKAIADLAKHSGFPRLRAELSRDPGVADLVRRGDDEPAEPKHDAPDSAWIADDVARGEFYGYSSAAILRFLKRR